MAQLWCVGEVRLARDGAQDTEAEKCGHSPESNREPLSVPGQGERSHAGVWALYPFTEHLLCARHCATSLWWGGGFICLSEFCKGNGIMTHLRKKKNNRGREKWCDPLHGWRACKKQGQDQRFSGCDAFFP